MENNKNVFDRWNETIRNVEGSIVNLVSAIAPWGAPLPAAYMSFTHMRDTLLFPFWIAFPISLVIEILGFSTVSTILSFWMHNRKYQDETKKSPVLLVIAAFAFYLLIVVTMNVLIDASVGQEWQRYAIIAVRALLTLMSIPAALVLAVRTQHQEMLNDFDEKKRERAYKKHYGDSWFEMMYGVSEGGGSLGSQTIENQQRTREHSEKHKDVLAYLNRIYSESGTVPRLSEIVSDCGVVKSYASSIRSEWAKEKGLK